MKIRLKKNERKIKAVARVTGSPTQIEGSFARKMRSCWRECSVRWLVRCGPMRAASERCRRSRGGGMPAHGCQLKYSSGTRWGTRYCGCITSLLENHRGGRVASDACPLFDGHPQYNCAARCWRAQLLWWTNSLQRDSDSQI